MEKWWPLRQLGHVCWWQAVTAYETVSLASWLPLLYVFLWHFIVFCQYDCNFIGAYGSLGLLDPCRLKVWWSLTAAAIPQTPKISYRALILPVAVLRDCCTYISCPLFVALHMAMHVFLLVVLTNFVSWWHLTFSWLSVWDVAFRINVETRSSVVGWGTML
jgi:hypothetical protein